MNNENENIDAAQVGKMFVTKVSFEWQTGGETYNEKTQKYEKSKGHWRINARLNSNASRYGDGQDMTLQVEHGIGQKLVEVLLPVVVADASKKAQQLADDSKAMLVALGERAQLCVTNMPAEEGEQKKQG